MYKESPALGISAGLIEGTIITTATTAKSPSEFQPRSTYTEILAVRERKARNRPPLRQHLTLQLLLRRRQLVRFALLCREEGRLLNEATWLFSMAWTIKALGGWATVQFKGMKEPQKQWHPILSRKELRRWTYQAGLHHITDAQLQQAETAVCRAPCQPISPPLQGAVLRVTAAERDRCWFWTVEAIDETPAQRRERKHREKLERDRKGKAARDEAKRQSGERRTRNQWLANCAAQRERDEAFCRLHGITKRTLRHWKQIGNSLCQGLVADIGRSPTTSETPTIERPDFGNAGDGMFPVADEGHAAAGKIIKNQRENRLTLDRNGQDEPPCRVIEPEPTAKPATSALALLCNKGVSDGRSLARDVELSSEGVRHWLQLLNATDTDYREQYLERHRPAA